MIYTEKNILFITYKIKSDIVELTNVKFFIHTINKLVLIDGSIIDMRTNIIEFLKKETYNSIREIHAFEAIYFLEYQEIHNLYNSAIINIKDTLRKYYFLHGMYYCDDKKTWNKDCLKYRRKEKLKELCI